MILFLILLSISSNNSLIIFDYVQSDIRFITIRGKDGDITYSQSYTDKVNRLTSNLQFE